MATIWKRLMTAMRAASYAFNEKALVATDNYTWDEFDSRLMRYYLYDAYYANIAYRDIATTSALLKKQRELYTNTRAIYNPVFRLVEGYVAKTYGGSLDFEDMSTGAIPLLMASEEVKAAVRQLWLWSNWRIQKGVYVRTGANLGDVAIKVVDEPDKGRVRMEVLHPGKIAAVTRDAVGNIKAATIEYVRTETTNGHETDYVYREEITQERFATFKDDKPFAYLTDGNGQARAEWENPYGFVPLVLVKHKDVGMQWGGNAYYAQTGKIDEVNDAASLLNDQVRKAINLMWYFAGVQRKAQLTASPDHRDEVPAIYGPEGSQPYPMVGQIDIAAAGANIDRMLLELERDNPELALHRLREGGNLTAPGVRSAYSDAIDRYTEAQGNYDDGLIRAQKMALSIGGFRRYAGFEPFDLSSYDKGDLEHFIKDRSIVADELSKAERLQALQAADAPVWLIMEELDFDQDKIDEVVAWKEEQTRNAVRGLAQGVFGEEDDDEETDEIDFADERANALPTAA